VTTELVSVAGPLRRSTQARPPRPLDDREIDAWVVALEHLADVGLRGLVPDDVRADARFRYLAVRAAA
jgi:hypothetical protein